MKSGIRRIFSGALTIALAIALSVPALAAELKSFKDVTPETHPASYEAIMAMAQRGIMGGTTAPDENGVGTFNPQGQMTRAHFIAVITRYLYKDELATMPKADKWYMNNYAVAVQHGLVKQSEFAGVDAVMNTPMTRQEMARVLIRAMGELGEDTSAKVSQSRIPDFNDIGEVYRDYVRASYKAGLICGTNKQGTFNPDGTLTRSQAAIVLYRLIEPSKRTPVSDVAVVTPDTPATQTPTGTQVFTEGSKHEPPKAGDVCVKADGTRVEVKAGPGGVLRAEGCDIYTGTVVNGVACKEGMLAYYDYQTFKKDSITGEMYSLGDWNTLRIVLNPTGKYVGDYNGEVYNTWFKWNSALEIWTWTGPFSMS